MFSACLASKEATATRQKLPVESLWRASHPRKQPRHDRNFRSNLSGVPRIQGSNRDMTETSGRIFLACLASLDARHARKIRPEVSVMSRLLPWMRGTPERFDRKFLSCRGCFLGCEARQRDSTGSFCRVAVASLDARHAENIARKVCVFQSGKTELTGGNSYGVSIGIERGAGRGVGQSMAQFYRLF